MTKTVQGSSIVLMMYEFGVSRPFAICFPSHQSSYRILISPLKNNRQSLTNCLPCMIDMLSSTSIAQYPFSAPILHDIFIDFPIDASYSLVKNPSAN